MTAIQPNQTPNALDVQVETLGQVKRRLRFAVPQPQIAAAFAQTTSKFASKVRVAGFRPGKAPAAMIERMHGQEIRRAALDDVLKVWVFKAIQATGLNPVGRPEVESVGELARDKPLSVQVMCEVLPTLELVGYEGAALTADAIAADAEDVEGALEQKARERAEQVPVETGVQDGDEAVASWTITDEGADAPRETAEQRKILIGAENLPFEVNELAKKATAGQEIVEDRAAEGTLSARKVTLTIHEAHRTEIPAVDDELAKDLGHADLAALKAAVQAEVDAEVAKRNLDARRNAAVDHLLANNPVELPQSFVDELVDQQLAQSFGHLDEKTLKSLGRFFQQMRVDMRKNTESALRRGLVLEALADKLGITPDDATIDAKLAELVAQNPSRQERIKRDYQGQAGRDELRRRVRSDAAMDELVRLATFTEGAQKTLRDAKAPATAEFAGDDAFDDDASFGEHDHDHDHDHGAHGHVHDENCNHG
jgi:trigger factor